MPTSSKLPRAHRPRYSLPGRWIALALLTGLAFPPASSAAPIATMIQYQATGVVEGSAPGSSLIGFTGYASRSAATPGVLDLGYFHVPVLPQGVTLTYASVPFEVTLLVGPPGAGALVGDKLLIDGVLNGTMDGNGRSTMTAMITNTSVHEVAGTSPISLASIHVLAPQAITYMPVVPTDGSNPNRLFAYVGPPVVPVPEPAATTLMFMVVAGLAIPAHRAWRVRRRTVQA